MRLNTYNSSRYTADLYDFVVTQDPTGGDILTYSFDRAVTLDASSDDTSELQTFFSEPFKQGQRLYNLRDRKGNELYPGGIWEFATIEPVINVWGYKDGYTARITMVAVEGDEA